MLGLTRREGEEVHLILEDGREIRLVLRHINGRQARLLFEAPQSIRILRAEVREREEKAR